MEDNSNAAFLKPQWADLPEGDEIVLPNGTTTFLPVAPAKDKALRHLIEAVTAKKQITSHKTTRKKNRRSRTRATPVESWLRLEHMRVPAEFVSFLRRCHAVSIGPLSNTPNTDLLTYLQSLPKEDLRSLVSDFIVTYPEHTGVYLELFHGETVGRQLGSVKPLVKVAMYQLALVEENLCTYALHFSDEFLYDASYNDQRTLTEVINKRVKSSLESIWRQKYGDPNNTLPRYWHVLDYSMDEKAKDKLQYAEDRGPGGFHVHGLITASIEDLPFIKVAFKKAAEGYVPRYRNKAVHFGEPLLDYSNRGGNSYNCLSDYPNAVRAKGEDYTFNAANYCLRDNELTVAAADRLKINVGKMWGRSPGLTREAQACLGIFNILLDNTPWSAENYTRTA